ncbi:monofunctional biosynthetic peptidoglycan transglycosylase [Jannaschia sp. CCS1]|uniref:Biosynthetic peptidoglycan transglycosylase n=1 Tax=Jannaschia sp. (strain CCS1) TaxID=290400 RepID=MTGA_JANSC|nr:monofunctional biosynthetic peptidoglycan transglycosylase [Jannaschia sp. CCS1]Q28VR9.1 RecName: Full=Biosynthetic peptidoglycan transglycosylase; AltName: Full=Glycan polymerase; AltName: Full=Peptidoglycan glycosyltransferase MtgA; Short=PGT [Jannaschia sp. CCS1]ABD53193.1 Monofunctional biosynthetic peptidoglycan transglycosylase [Jannaschia sp. CCS1]
MAKRARKSKKNVSRARLLAQAMRRWLLRGMFGLGALMLVWIVAYAVVPVPTTIYMQQERARLGGIERDWVPMDQIAPVLARSVVAAEDANFCLHWGFDMTAIRDAIADGAARGGSTISQQTVKNAFLWHGRSWVRKALEAAITPVMELVWPKRRVLEVYLNVAEFAPGVFGAEAGAQHHFGVSAADLTARQASLMAAVLPNPQRRDAGSPSDLVNRRARSIADGAALIRADGRADCFAN